MGRGATRGNTWRLVGVVLLILLDITVDSAYEKLEGPAASDSSSNLISDWQTVRRTTDTRQLMGTTVTIIVLHSDVNEAERVIHLAFKEIEKVDSLMSSYKNDSEVSRLNKNGHINDASDAFIYNIKKALYYSNLTRGAFDITVKPILDLYSDCFKNKQRPPTRHEINDVLRLVDYNNIILDGRSVKLRTPGMKITLGGIAKGYAVDKAAEVLQKNNIRHALVDAGGDIRAIGRKGTEPWSIALENPRNKGDYITIIKLSDQSVATSGDYERYFDEDKKYHHIINPRTGYSATELISVTIITENTTDADVLATSVFVLGKEEGLALIEELDNVEGLLITKDKKIIKSKGW